MAINNLLKEISTDVDDVVNTKFNYYTTQNVPSSEDSLLTFERGVEKKGKEIETCVLFVDIRNSVFLNEKHHTQTMGRLYTAFIKAVLKAAQYHGGFVRNIIGDRVMVVFPTENCFTNAVDCAITINHLSQNIIANKFSKIDFKTGIGIDYGKLRVIKVGVQKQGAERTENKGLVWVGYPANIASRLTDIANKTIEVEYYIVKRNPINPSHIFPALLPQIPGLPTRRTISDVPLYLDRIETKRMTTKEFADNISSFRDGELYMQGGKYITHEKKTEKINLEPILMTSNVYSGYKRENPECNTIKAGYWKKVNYKFDNIISDIYNGGVCWDV